MSTTPNFNAASLPPVSPQDVKAFLALAAGGSNADLVAMIKKLGPELLEVRGEGGRTALIHAAQTGHSGAVHLLVKSGADINARDDNGDTALIVAARHGFKGLAQALLDRGADMASANHQGQTALHLAATHRNNHDRMHPMSKKKKETVRLLLDRGAKTDVTDNRGHTPESWARRFGYADVAAMIAEEEALRRRRRAEDIALFTEGLPEDITVTRLRLRHRNGPWKG